MISKLILFVSFLTCAFGFSSTRKSASSSNQHFNKVIWIIFENKDYMSALNQPDFKALTQFGALLTNMLAETHPSQPNYIAMIAGSTMNVRTDKSVDLNEKHIGDLLESAGMDWRVYAENYPGRCFKDSINHYARRHVPFMSFTNVSSDSKRCSKIVNADTFDSDFSNGLLPEFSMYIPNTLNDGHNTNVDYAGKWLTKKFGKILSKPGDLKDTLFIITFDEDERKNGNKIFTVLIGDHVQPGSQNIQDLNHISLLKMIEDEFHLGTLGREDSKQNSVDQIWK